MTFKMISLEEMKEKIANEKEYHLSAVETLESFCDLIEKGFVVFHEEEIVSQKALGIKELGRQASSFSLPYMIFTKDTPKDHFISEISNHFSYTAHAIFVRPCPKSPRHGIIESEKTNLQDLPEVLSKLEAKMLSLGEEPVIVVQPYIQADYNIVWDDRHIIIAPDNDGVTAGKKPSVTIKANFPVYIKVENTKDYELELIGNKDQIYLVQIRKSPPGKGSCVLPSNAIEGFLHKPSLNVRKTKIIEIRGLNELELLESLNGSKEDYLVLHPEGSLLSHASAWCRQNNMSYLICDKDKLTKPFLQEIHDGDETYVVLTNDDVFSPVIEKPSPAHYYKHLMQGINDSFERDSCRLELVLFFHNFICCTALGKEVAYLAGYHIGSLLRVSLAICMGELRHSHDIQPFASIDDFHFPVCQEEKDFRSLIYDEVLSSRIDAETMEVAFTNCQLLFSNLFWEKGYGGPKWARIAKLAAELVKAIRQKNTKTKVNKILNKANILTNTAHNNGWAFDKLEDKSMLDLPYFLNGRKRFLPLLARSASKAMEVLCQKTKPCSKQIVITARKDLQHNPVQEVVKHIIGQKG
jgi:hypothetical protein